MAFIQTRRTQDGKVRYRVQIRLKGYPTQTATFARKTDAKMWAEDTESAIRGRRHFKTAEAKKHTLSELIDRYILEVLPEKSKSSQINQKSQLSWWRSELGEYLLADISTALIVEARNTLQNQQTRYGKLRSSASVVRFMAALSHVFTVAVNEWEWLEDTPMRKVSKPKEPRGRVRFLSDSERETLLKACSESKNPVLYPAVVLALSTGMRQGEILNLRWADVDLTGGRITLHDTKNNERRVAPLAGHALDVISDYVKVRRLDTNLVFPGRSLTSHKPMDIRLPWTTAVKRAGITDFRFHDLRHSAASYLAMNGASLAEIAEVLGHRTLQMVQRYAHLSEAHTAGVVSRMNERIFGEHST